MLSKTWVITVREYLAAVRTKSFIVSVILMPLMMFGSIAIQRATRDIVDLKDRQVMVIDHTGGKMFEAITAANDERNARDINDKETGNQKLPKFVFTRVDAPSVDDKDALLAKRIELSEKVQKQDIFAFVEIGRDIFAPRQMAAATQPGLAPPVGGANNLDPDAALAMAAEALGDDNIVRYTTSKITSMGVQSFLQAVVNRTVFQERFSKLANAKLTPQEFRNILTPALIAPKGPTFRDETGKIKEQGESGQFMAFMRPLALIFLMFIVVLVGVSPLATNIIEEKNLRIAEVLLGSVGPFDLMLGKLLGGVGVALTLAVIYLTTAYIGLKHGMQGFDVTQYLNGPLVAWFLVFTVMATLLFGSMFVAAGAAVTNVKEAQSLITPIMLVITLPMFFIGPLLNDPGGPIPMALTFFPFSAPMVSVARLSIPPGIPAWQMVVACMSTLLATVVLVWVAGRVFRVGILMSGQAPKFSQLIRWVVNG
jgi:ABC-type Na+ efflux pump permease subunit